MKPWQYMGVISFSGANPQYIFFMPFYSIHEFLISNLTINCCLLELSNACEYVLSSLKVDAKQSLLVKTWKQNAYIVNC